MPSLQQLFGQSLQLRRIGCGVNGPGKTFDLKLLTRCEFLRARHHGKSGERANGIGRTLLSCSENDIQAGCEQINSRNEWTNQFTSLVRSVRDIAVFQIT
jgi:hypothetical protein